MKRSIIFFAIIEESLNLGLAELPIMTSLKFSLNSLLKASSVYQLPDLSLIGDGSKMNLVVRDKCNNGSNVYNVDVGQTSSTFCFNFKVENLKILPGVYNVTISSPNLSVFKHTRLDLCYWIALEPDSTYES